MNPLPGHRARPFVDRPVGDVALATRAARVAASRWGLPAPVLLRSSMNAVFRSGEVVLRASTPTVEASAALALAGMLAGAGVRVMAPRRSDVIVSDGVSVTCWEFIESVGDAIDWVGVGRMLRRLHDLDPATVPAAFPLPSPAGFPWWDFDSLLDDVGADLDGRAAAALRSAVERHRDWAAFDRVVLCHGDVHPGNVIAGPDGPVLLDWDLACLAPPGWDHAPMMTWAQRWGGGAGEYERLAEGYGATLRGEPSAEAFAELRLVAATLMRVRAGRTDPAARREAERRLRYWRGESDAPAWQAQ